MKVQRFVGALVAVVIATVGVSACGSDHADANPDAAFAQMMIPHHEQAMVMSDFALVNNASPEVSALAIQIQSAQGPEIAQMRAILDRLGIVEIHDHGDHDMAGMLTDRELAAMGELQGSAFDAVFIQNMIFHHEGAIEMAEEVLANGSDPEVQELAQAIIESQRAEIQEMNELLASQPGN
jgi:uncharacterized protein (DUF305 family)